MLVGWIKLLSQLLAIFHPSSSLRSYLYCHLQPCPCPPCPGPLPPHSGLTGCLLTCQTCSCLETCCTFFLELFLWNIRDCLFLASQLKCHLLREIFLIHFFSQLPFCLSIQPSSHPSIQFFIHPLTDVHCIHIMVLGAGNMVNKTDDFSALFGVSCFLVNYIIPSLATE